MTKVMLALIDGMRPDSLPVVDHPFYHELLKTSRYSLRMQTVMPSVTLPCHMSLFHSVTPERHGILTNTYVPQVRPINGLCEVLGAAGRNCAFFYSWEPLRDLARPLSIARADFISGRRKGCADADRAMSERVVRMLKEEELPDFTFFYICWVDEAGHKYGWMTDEYFQSVKDSLDYVQRAAEFLPEDCCLIVTADHGGHERSHGKDFPEDMTIPIFFRQKGIAPGEFAEEVSILDIAPTIASLLGVPADPDWEGRSLL